MCLFVYVAERCISMWTSFQNSIKFLLFCRIDHKKRNCYCKRKLIEDGPPAARTLPKARCNSVQTPTWTITTPDSPLDPFVTSVNSPSIAPVHLSLTISCVSKGIFVYLRAHRMVPGPRVKLRIKIRIVHGGTQPFPISCSLFRVSQNLPAGRR